MSSGKVQTSVGGSQKGKPHLEDMTLNYSYITRKWPDGISPLFSYPLLPRACIK